MPTGSDESFKLVDGLSAERVLNRVSLADQFDRIRRDVDQSNTFDNLDDINRQAQEVILSGRARKAFDLSDEDPKLRELYGPGWGEQALLARRFVEAGVLRNLEHRLLGRPREHQGPPGRQAAAT